VSQNNGLLHLLLGLGKNVTTSHHYHDITPRKPQIQIEKIHFSILIRRLAESMKGLNGSVAQLVGELQHCKALQKSGECGT